ncbi:MAG: tRNA pseudouridine(55) synthase TruB [bacterium]
MNKTYRPAPPRALDPWDGVLLVDKPSGPTSHDVVARIRRHFQIKKVGHGGTLDPMATGLLIILLGKGTKLSGQIMGCDKVYEGTMRLGVSTDTQDGDGQVVTERDPSGVTCDQLLEEMKKRTGDIQQVPPMVSAIKRNGVPLYKLARKGLSVEREPRLIHVYQFHLLDFSPPFVSFRLRCTKGTYVRTLCADIGDALGCGAHLASLRRTESGTFRLADAVSFNDLLRLSSSELAGRIIPSSEFRLQGHTA